MPIKWHDVMLVEWIYGKHYGDDFSSKRISNRGPFISAIGRCYCVDHFTCSNCSINLQDCGFVEENGKLYCENDFEQYLAPFCGKCSQKILKVTSKFLFILITSLHSPRNVFMPWKKPGILNVFSVRLARNLLVQIRFTSKKVNRTVLKVILPCR